MTTPPIAPEWLVLPTDANELVEAVWPSSAHRSTAGELTIGGVTASALQQSYGTPLYVVDEGDVRARATRIRDAFTNAFAPHGAEVTVYYAGKAFLTIEVAKWMAELGLNIDVCSGGELAVVEAAGIASSRVGLHGNNKSVAEIDRAVASGLGAIVLDSIIEIERVARAAAARGRVQNVRLRINSGVHASTHEYLATAREDQKFGIPIADAAAAVAAIRSHDSLRFLGLHSHIGSQIFEAGGFSEAAHRLLALHAELLAGGEIPELNLGGGFGIAYTSVDQVTPIETIAQQLADAVSTECARHGIPVPQIAIEPGRAIIGPAGVTLYEVGTVKDVTVYENAVRRYVSVDGGMSDNLRTALYHADYTARLAARTSDAAPALVRVAGKHCESGDIVVRDDYLPGDVQPGDLLAVAATGAYCWSLASNYNYLGRPAVVAVQGGESRVLVRRETEHDLLRRDAGYSESIPNTEH